MPKKQKSGLYRTKVKVGTDQTGKPIVKWVSGKTQKELEDAKREVIAHYVEGRAAMSDRLLGDYAVQWFNVVKAPGLSPSSLESYRTALNKDILPPLGERNLRAITATELQALVNGYAGMSATKITVVCAALSGLFDAACADGLIASNPMDHVRKPKATPAAEKTILSADQRRAVERVCASDPRAVYLALMYYLGLRPGEARGLMWGDIDFDARTLHIQRDIDYKAGGRAGQLKTPKSNRVIPLPDALSAILSGFRGLPATFVVQGAKGGVLSKASAERLWCELMIACGLVVPAESSNYRSGDPRAHWTPIITPHALRHNFASMCWENGLDAYTAMRLLGHSSIKTTMDIYTHLSDAQLHQIGSKVDAMFSKQSCTKVAQVPPSDAGAKK